MRLLPFSDEEPNKIGTVEVRVMRCGHRQSLYAAAKLPEEYRDPESWEDDFRERFERDLTWQLDHTSKTQDCSKCESAGGLR